MCVISYYGMNITLSVMVFHWVRHSIPQMVDTIICFLYRTHSLGCDISNVKLLRTCGEVKGPTDTCMVLLTVVGSFMMPCEVTFSVLVSKKSCDTRCWLPWYHVTLMSCNVMSTQLDWCYKLLKSLWGSISYFSSYRVDSAGGKGLTCWLAIPSNLSQTSVKSCDLGYLSCDSR